MAKELNYKDAIEELEQLAHQIENEEPDIDELGTMVSRAKELILFCKKRLKKTEGEIDDAMEELDS